MAGPLQLCFLSLVILACTVQHAESQRDRVEELVQGIRAAILGELQPVLQEIKDDLHCLKRNMSILDERVQNLTMFVNQHSSHTASGLAEIRNLLFQINIPAEPPTIAPQAQVPQVAMDTLASDMHAMMDTLAQMKIQWEENLEAVVNNSAKNGSICCDSGGSKEGPTMTQLLLELNQNMQQNFNLQMKNSYGYVTTPPEYTCKGEGGWRRVFYLNMTDSGTVCPSGWKYYSTKPACGRSTAGTHTCDSVFVRVMGAPYTRVCGSIKAYQVGPTDAFEAYDEGVVTSIDGAYVSGVSLTHGSPRQHIWTFAAGVRETHHSRNDACPCDATIPISIPADVNGNYFCESGFNDHSTTGLNFNDPLWDGQDCSASSACCSFNSPPYFCTELPGPTWNDIEARICHKDDNEDTPIEFIELYVQ